VVERPSSGFTCCWFRSGLYGVVRKGEGAGEERGGFVGLLFCAGGGNPCCSTKVEATG